jgi:hypothetical protein
MRGKIFEVSTFPKAYQKVLSSESVEVIGTEHDREIGTK